MCKKKKVVVRGSKHGVIMEEEKGGSLGSETERQDGKRVSLGKDKGGS